MVPASDPPPDDALLLRRYVREGSEAAFRALAERHLPLVWSAARRIVNGDNTLAEDIAQSVLTDFALKAATLPPGMPPAGWLHRHTVFTATKALRSESRRRAREQRAATPPDDPMPASADTWAELAPHLDTALNRLRDADRQAILLRYYEKRPLREISRALGTTEEAVRKRLDRALTKLRTHLSRRGIVPALAIFLTLLRDESVAAPPAAVARRIAAGAWAGVEGGALSAVTALPWWRSRYTIAGTAGVVALVLLVLFARGDWSSAGEPPRERAGAAPPAAKPAAAPAAKEYPAVTLTATLMTLPAKDVAGLLWDYTPGNDDKALFQQLLPRATALQKLVKKEETYATAGHPLVILSGPAKPSAAALTNPAKRDPFGVSVPSAAGPSATLQTNGYYKYPTEFDPPDKKGRIKPSAIESREMGTFLEANLTPPAADGSLLIECSMHHMFAPPEEEEFYTTRGDGSAHPDKEDSIHYPVMHNTQWRAGPLRLPPNAPVLAGMMRVPAAFLPEGETEPRTILLFLQFQP